MHHKPLVSIIILSFNHQNFIEEAVLSAISQQGNFISEIIIGDDASNDDTQIILKNLQTKYPKIIKLNFQTKNIGVWENLSSTIKKSSGSYLALLDGDDFWLDPFKIDKQLELILSDESIGLVHTNFKQLKEDKLISDNVLNPALVPQGFIYNKLMISNFIANSTVLVKRHAILNAITTLNQYKDVLFIQDYPIWLHISMYNKIAFLAQSTLMYRVLPISHSHFQSIDQKIQRITEVFQLKIFFSKNMEAITKADFINIEALYLRERQLLLWKNHKNINLNFTDLIKHYKTHRKLLPILKFPAMVMRLILKNY